MYRLHPRVRERVAESRVVGRHAGQPNATYAPRYELQRESYAARETFDNNSTVAAR